MMTIVKEKFSRILEQWPVAMLVAGVVLTLLWVGALAWMTQVILRLL